jgi:hypothetical protein
LSLPVGDALRDPVFGTEKSGFDENLLHDSTLAGAVRFVRSVRA